MRSNSLRSGRPANSMEQDSFDSFDDMEDMLVMSANMNLNSQGGPRDLLNPASHLDQSPLNVSGSEQEDDLPRSIIVTNVCMSVFDNDDLKANFETMFRDLDQKAVFHYLRSFRRIRVDYGHHVSAAEAKRNLDGTPVGDSVINVYFVQVLSPCTDEDAFLHVPPLEKQFLISPPCSPPVGWEQPPEGRPVVDYDLLAAVAQLSPGKNHELHPSKEVTVLGKSISTPSIVVHVCEEAEATVTAGPSTAVPTTSGKINFSKSRNTPRPDRQSSLD